MRYLFQIIRHKWFILIAGLRIGGVSLWQLAIHDWAKFLPAEFIAYQKKFIYHNCSEDEWNLAWLHHIHHSRHHWEHWILCDQALPMPERYWREMVVDWFAAGRSYTGSWEIREWLQREFPRMQLQEQTKAEILGLLWSLGIEL